MGQCSTKPLADGEQAPAAPLTRSEQKRAAKELARRAKKASSHASQLARRADARGPARTLAVAAHRRIADAACCSSHALSQRVSGLRTLDQLLPRRGSDGFIADQLARRESMPTAPAVLYTAMHEAIQAGNLQWATSNAEVAALLAEDVTYVDLRGEEAVGKEATLKSMDEGAMTTRAGGAGAAAPALMTDACAFSRGASAASHQPIHTQRQDGGD